MTSADRVRKHRAKLSEQQCARLVVWLAGGLIDRIRELAKSIGPKTWKEVEDVMTLHLQQRAGDES